MDSPHLKRLAMSYVRSHCTRDPIRITRESGYLVIFTKLNGIRGFFQRLNRQKIIYINDELDYWQMRFVCAHEFAHSLLHKNYNRIFMDTFTYMNTDKYEWEADCFAGFMMFDDDDLAGLINEPADKVARMLGISGRLAALLMENVDLDIAKGYINE